MHDFYGVWTHFEPLIDKGDGEGERVYLINKSLSMASLKLCKLTFE